jgi:hypothetical protein
VHVFDQQRGESAQAFAAFRTYRDLGPDRSLDAAFQQRGGRRAGGKRASGRWCSWSARWEWVKRAAAFDQHNQRVEEAARDAALAAEAERWAKRQAAIPEQEFAVGIRLLREVNRRLNLPGASLAHLASTADAGSKIARRAARMPIEIEPAPPANWDQVLFESSGKIAQAMPEGAVPEMPADVFGVPRIAAAGAGVQEAELPGGRRARQPARPVRPQPV